MRMNIVYYYWVMVGWGDYMLGVNKIDFIYF